MRMTPTRRWPPSPKIAAARWWPSADETVTASISACKATTRRCSLPSEDLFLSSTPAMDAATRGRAWVAAFLRVERALATAEEQLGVIPEGAAERIATAAAAVEEAIALSTIAEDALVAGTPIVPLVRALRDAAGEAGQWVHHGATSQDIIDTALALVVRQATSVMMETIVAIEQSLAGLAHRHRHTVMAGRTLLQQGAVTTFGLKAAGWLNGMLDAHQALLTAIRDFPVQFGGAVGSLSDLGDRGIEVSERLAAALGLPGPPLPWH